MAVVKGKVHKSKFKDGKFMTLLVLNGKMPREGESVSLKWGAKRSLSQNAFLWVYYDWLINHAGLKEQGHFCAEALHLNLKQHFLAEKVMTKDGFKAVEEATSTTLNKVEFGEFMEKISQFMLEFFEIDSQPFYDEHIKNYT